MKPALVHRMEGRKRGKAPCLRWKKRKRMGGRNGHLPTCGPTRQPLLFACEKGGTLVLKAGERGGKEKRGVLLRKTSTIWKAKSRISQAALFERRRGKKGLSVLIRAKEGREQHKHPYIEKLASCNVYRRENMLESHFVSPSLGKREGGGGDRERGFCRERRKKKRREE